MDDSNAQGLRDCVRPWNPPASARVGGELPAWRARLELHIVSYEDELEIVSASVLEENVADAELEACITALYRGRFPLRGAVAGKRYKVAYPITWFKR